MRCRSCKTVNDPFYAPDGKMITWLVRGGFEPCLAHQLAHEDPWFRYHLELALDKPFEHHEK